MARTKPKHIFLSALLAAERAQRSGKTEIQHQGSCLKRKHHLLTWIRSEIGARFWTTVPVSWPNSNPQKKCANSTRGYRFTAAETSLNGRRQSQILRAFALITPTRTSGCSGTTWNAVLFCSIVNVVRTWRADYLPPYCVCVCVSHLQKAQLPTRLRHKWTVQCYECVRLFFSSPLFYFRFVSLAAELARVNPGRNSACLTPLLRPYISLHTHTHTYGAAGDPRWLLHSLGLGRKWLYGTGMAGKVERTVSRAMELGPQNPRYRLSVWQLTQSENSTSITTRSVCVWVCRVL